jgi:hypothetical protein
MYAQLALFTDDYQKQRVPDIGEVLPISSSSSRRSAPASGDSQLQEVLADDELPRKVALCWKQFRCASIARHDMTKHERGYSC